MSNSKGRLPLISIIIPVYNQQKELMLALDSIEKQTYKNVEAIIIDDGSQPAVILSEVERSETESKDLVGLQQRRDPSAPLRSARDDVALFRQENMGAPAARNKGFEMSRGEYVIFWDADVVGKPEMLERLEKALKVNPKASYAYCNYYFGKKKMKAGEFDPERLKKLNYIHSTSLIRRKDVVKWDESLKRFQDWDLWLTMLEKGKKGIYVPGVLFKVQTGGTMSSWLPSFAYRAPWKFLPFFRDKVNSYDTSRKVVVGKHKL